MSKDYQSGKFEDGSVLPEEEFQESLKRWTLEAALYERPVGGEPRTV